MQESFFGARRFGEFVSALEIPKARLSERLRHLVDEGLLNRIPIAESPRHHEYRLTEKGRAVYPVALALLAWSGGWRGEQQESALGLVHETCGATLSVEFKCRECDEAIRRKDLQWPPIASLEQVSPTGSGVGRWRQARAGMASIHGEPVVGALRVLGDRWSMLIMYVAQVGSFRFGEAQARLGIATNILTHRLAELVAQRVLERVDTKGGHHYRATAAGLDLLGAVVAARTWSIDWVSIGRSSWTELLHKPCETNLRVDCRCQRCGSLVLPHEVSRATSRRSASRN